MGMPRAVAERLGEHRVVTGTVDWLTMLDQLERVLFHDEIWDSVSGNDRRELMALVVARARYLQDEVAVPSGSAARLGSLFRLMTRRSRDVDVGFVTGLSASHRPSLGSWEAEARAAWRRVSGRAGLQVKSDAETLLVELAQSMAQALETGTLVDRVEAIISAGMASDDARLLELVVPHASVFQGQSRCKTLKSVLKARHSQEEADEAAVDARVSRVPDGVLARTRGRRAVVVGGDCRNLALTRIQTAFGFAVVEWDTAHQVRRISSLAERIKRGGVDTVIILTRFISHRVTDILLPALKARPEVQVVWVDRGYGVAALTQAMQVAAASPT